jgi:hypothetical protein
MTDLSASSFLSVVLLSCPISAHQTPNLIKGANNRPRDQLEKAERSVAQK